MKDLHRIYRGTAPGIVAGGLAALVCAFFIAEKAFYEGSWLAFALLLMGFWGVIAVAQIWERCDRYERLLRTHGIDPLEAYSKIPSH